MNKMDLDNIIITQQQEEGLAAFRKQQKEVEELQDKDFFAFYICWQYENGFFLDHNLIASFFKESVV